VTEFNDRDLIDVVIDGQSIAVPAGSTIRDAAARLGIVIPSLCHSDALPPAGVCRVCVVDAGESTLTPACCRTVGSLANDRRVATHRTSVRVRRSIETLVELLLAEHPDWKPGRPAAGEWLEETEGSGQWAMGSGQETGRDDRRSLSQSTILDPRQTTSNPVVALAERFGLSRSRFASRPVARQRDATSPIISVDHSACILCERCVRTCGEGQHHDVILRAGSGHAARITFDFDRPLGDSSCVACGACVPACPTGALAFGVEQRGTREAAQALERNPMFTGLAPELLERLAGIVVRHTFRPGDVICREGERGATAFLIEAGDVQVAIETPLGHVQSWKGRQSRTRWGPFGLIWRFETTLERSGDGSARAAFTPIDAPEFLPVDRPVAALRAGDVFGETTAILGLPRSATARAMSEVTLLELPREAMFVLRQNPASRAMFDEAYLDRTLPRHLSRIAGIDRLAGGSDSLDEIARRLRPNVWFRRFAPGDVIARCGERLDAVWLVRFGFVEETRFAGNDSHVATYIGRGGSFGDEALSRCIENGSACADAVEAPATWRAITAADVACVDFTAMHFSLETISKPRTGATGSFLPVRASLDITGADKPPVAPGAATGSGTEERLGRPSSPAALPRRERGEVSDVADTAHSIDEFVLRHLARAERLVAIDLTKCIHCDDCVRACGESHGGVTRLVPDGMRVNDRLLPTTCIACLNPVCLTGCPVGAIERLASREIAIADWCTGCGSCAERCPYGNLAIHGVEATARADKPTKASGVAVAKPVTCDGCREFTEGQPPCVTACAHDAIAIASGSNFVRQPD
jgi:Fe-S-cluster-containing hydrogenase component 2/CRP-like cAMP-binding protein